MKISNRSTELLESIFLEKKSVAYYPSAGMDKNIFLFPFDVLILSDALRFEHTSKRMNGIIYDQTLIGAFILELFDEYLDHIESNIDSELSYAVISKKDKIFIYFFEDNNITLERLKNYKLKLDGFISINDGCNEGGSDKEHCINSEDWIFKIQDIFSDDVIRVRDHFTYRKDYIISWREKYVNYDQNYFEEIQILGGESSTGKKRKLILEKIYHYDLEVKKIENLFKDGILTEKGKTNRLGKLEEKYKLINN